MEIATAYSQSKNTNQSKVIELLTMFGHFVNIMPYYNDYRELRKKMMRLCKFTLEFWKKYEGIFHDLRLKNDIHDDKYILGHIGNKYSAGSSLSFHHTFFITLDNNTFDKLYNEFKYCMFPQDCTINFIINTKKSYQITESQGIKLKKMIEDAFPQIINRLGLAPCEEKQTNEVGEILSAIFDLYLSKKKQVSLIEMSNIKFTKSLFFDVLKLLSTLDWWNLSRVEGCQRIINLNVSKIETDVIYFSFQTKSLNKGSMLQTMYDLILPIVTTLLSDTNFTTMNIVMRGLRSDLVDIGVHNLQSGGDENSFELERINKTEYRVIIKPEPKCDLIDFSQLNI